MPVSKTLIEQNINTLINSIKEKEPEQAQADYVSGMAQIIYDAITSGTVTVNPGIGVTTTGTATAQSGVTVGSGVGSIS